MTRTTSMTEQKCENGHLASFSILRERANIFIGHTVSYNIDNFYICQCLCQIFVLGLCWFCETIVKYSLFLYFVSLLIRATLKKNISCNAPGKPCGIGVTTVGILTMNSFL